MLSDKFLENKVILITGGGTGLGKSMALQCAQRGAKVVISGRRKEVLEETANEITKVTSQILPIQSDVREPDQVQNMVDETVKKFGTIDALINNAAGNFICPAEKLSVNGWNAVINIV